MLHVGGGKPHHVERAVEIDVDDALEIGERHRAVAPDDALGRPDAGAIDEDARRPIALARFGERGGGLLRIGDVAGNRMAADPRRHLARPFEVDVEAGDLGAGAGELACGGGAEAGGAAGDHRGVSADVHDQLLRAAAASGFSISSAMPWPPPMHAAAIPSRSRARLSSRASVIASRTPVAPSGWPMAIAPPLTLSLASSMPSSRAQAITWAPNASLISKRSMSASLWPARSSTALMAGTGPMPMISGGTPTVAPATMRASESLPGRFA